MWPVIRYVAEDSNKLDERDAPCTIARPFVANLSRRTSEIHRSSEAGGLDRQYVAY